MGANRKGQASIYSLMETPELLAEARRIIPLCEGGGARDITNLLTGFIDLVERLSSPAFTDAQIERAARAFTEDLGLWAGGWENLHHMKQREVKLAIKAALAALLAEGGEG